MEVRNKLLHRPGEQVVSFTEARDYVCEVENAIYHLLHKLYPNDPIIDRLYPSIRKG